ncbi:MAG: hypothetical protein JSR33_02290 [Proteobacteria bacterium]|nr:hypothetical protein [Pseudomonadota bacterium]
MQSRKILLILYLMLFAHIVSAGLIMPVSAHMLGISKSGSILMSQLAESQDTTLEFWFIIIFFPYLLATLFFTLDCKKPRRKTMLVNCFFFGTIGHVFLFFSTLVNNIFLTLIGFTFLAVGSAGTAIIQAFITDFKEPLLKKTYKLGIVAAVLTAFYIPVAQLSEDLLITYPNIFSYSAIITIGFALSLLSTLLGAWFLPKADKSGKKTDGFIFEDIVSSLSNILSNKNCRFLLSVLTLFQLGWGLFFQNSYYYMTNFQKFCQLHTCLFIAYLCLWPAIILIVLFPLFLRTCSPRMLISLCLLLSGIGIAISPYFINAKMQWLIASLIAAATGMTAPTIWGLLTEYVDDHVYGTLMGLTGIIWAMTWTLSGELVSLLNSFSWRLPLETAASLMVVAVCRILLTIAPLKKVGRRKFDFGFWFHQRKVFYFVQKYWRSYSKFH